MSNQTLYRIAVFVALYIAAQIFADITSLRILTIAGLSIDGGTLIYPVTFTLRDVIHKATNATLARIVIFTAAGINLFMAFLFWVVSVLPPDMMVGEQAAFGAVLTPVFRIVLASIVAEVIAELIDTEVYERWVKRVGYKWQFGRVLSSNAISVPVDSVLFSLIAFWGVFPPEVVFGIFVTNTIVKYGMSVLSVPLIYAVDDQRQHKHASQTRN